MPEFGASPPWKCSFFFYDAPGMFVSYVGAALQSAHVEDVAVSKGVN